MAEVKVLLIGYGAMAREIARRLADATSPAVAAVLVRPHRVAEVARELASPVVAVSDLDALEARPDIAAECAGHGGLARHGAEVLRRGIDLVVISTGALVDDALREDLFRAAREGGAKVLLPAGAVAGIDALAAARAGGLERVVYSSRKPPASWKGTPAEDVVDLDAVREATVIFEGAAADAARLYPRNANVAATVALAGLGLRRTRVTLIADPHASGNIHRIEAAGGFGELDIEVKGRPLAENPKTSALAAYSVVRALRNRAGAVEI